MENITRKEVKKIVDSYIKKTTYFWIYLGDEENIERNIYNYLISSSTLSIIRLLSEDIKDFTYSKIIKKIPNFILNEEEFNEWKKGLERAGTYKKNTEEDKLKKLILYLENSLKNIKNKKVKKEAKILIKTIKEEKKSIMGKEIPITIYRASNVNYSIIIKSLVKRYRLKNC